MASVTKLQGFVVWVCGMLLYFSVAFAIPLFIVFIYMHWWFIATFWGAVMLWGILAEERVSPALRAWFHRSRQWFDRCKIVFEHKPNEYETRVLYLVHPHGIFSCGTSVLSFHSAMKHLRFLTTFWMKLPFFGGIIGKRVVKIGTVMKAEMLSRMQSGESLMYLPGGFEEASLFRYRYFNVFLKERKGFIKYSLMHGYSLVPVYVFGEERTFYNAHGLNTIKMWLNKYSLPSVFPWGFWLLPFVPRPDLYMYIVVGEPLNLPLIERPTTEDVDKWHNKYVHELVSLFDRHKAKAGNKGAILEVS